MKTLLLEPDAAGIRHAAELMRAGELVAFPTETVYGLAAPIDNLGAIAQIFAVKGRPNDNPLIVHVASLAQIELIAELPAGYCMPLFDHFFPGPLTLVLRKRALVPDCVSAAKATVAVRMPAHPVARALIAEMGIPLVAPSANLSGRPSSTTAEHVMEDFSGKIAAIIDAGPCSIGLESTVLSLIGTPTLLRPGAITQETLETHLKRKIRTSYSVQEGETPSAPGMKYRHYAPRGRIQLFSCEKEASAYLASCRLRCCLIRPTAATLYHELRLADQEGIEELLVVADEAVQGDAALYNRLLKAAQI